MVKSLIRGCVKNHSSVPLLVVETTTNDPKGPAIAHILSPNMKSPPQIDADGFKRVDGKSINGHGNWWKIRDFSTVDIYSDGESLMVKVIDMKPVGENEFVTEDFQGKVLYDHSAGWGVPMKSVTQTTKGKTGSLETFFVEGLGWIDKDHALALAEQGELENAVVVRPAKGLPYLRARPDRNGSNNFLALAITTLTA